MMTLQMLHRRCAIISTPFKSFVRSKMKTILLQVYTLTSVVNACVNSPFTSIIDSEIAHPDRYEVSRAEYRNATLDAFSDHMTCDNSPIMPHTPLHMRAMCPWEYVYDTDVDRFPAVLTVAKCKCSTCADHFRCWPVLYTIHVLKKVCKDNVIRWLRRTELISVACTCVRPTVHEVHKRLQLFRAPKKRTNVSTFLEKHIESLLELEEMYANLPQL